MQEANLMYHILSAFTTHSLFYLLYWCMTASDPVSIPTRLPYHSRPDGQPAEMTLNKEDLSRLQAGELFNDALIDLGLR